MQICKEIAIKNIEQKGIIEKLKFIFSSKDNLQSLYNLESNSYSFSYFDEIKEEKVLININIRLSHEKKNNVNIKLNIQTDHENISNYDLEHYYFQCIYVIITEDLLNEGDIEYTIRVYYKILHDKGFQGEYIIRWKNNKKIRFKPLFNERLKNTVGERIICVDCEVNAKSLAHARSQAINISKDFLSYLSLLTGIGFYEMHSKFMHFITNGNNELNFSYARHAFFDQELNLFVKDNMNGLNHKDDSVSIPSFQSFHTVGADGFKITGSYFANKDDNVHMDNVFKKLRITKSKTQNPYSDSIKIEPIYYSSSLQIPRQIRAYYRGILDLDNKKSISFRNACRLYNISQTCGAYEPTLMLAYMVSAVECIAKSEKKSFSSFCSTYLKDEYDKEICDFLYGNLRSGHFHSGEIFFTEYNINLDITLEPNFQSLTNIYNKGRYILRKTFINWVITNVIRE